MAETVGVIQYDVRLDTSNIKKQAQKVEQDLESSAKKTSSAVSGMISGAFMAITNRAIDAVSNLTGEMMNLYDSAQKFPKVIESMGGSTNFANQAFADMKKYADDTIYSLEDMTGTFGMLYGTAGDDTIKLVKALGGVSALAEDSGKAMKSWSLQLTQMVNKPMVSWMDFKILLEQNPGAIAKIAEAMDKTTKQLIQDVSDGTQATEEFLNAFKKVGNSNDLQKMATSSDNFKNSLGQLQASVVSAGLELLEVFGPTIIGSINAVTKAIDWLREFFKVYLPDGIKNTKQVLTDFKNVALDVLRTIEGWILEHRLLLTNIAIILGTIVAPAVVKTTSIIIANLAKIVAQTVATSVTMSAQAVKAFAVWSIQSAIMVGKVIAGFVAMSAQAVVNAVKIGASWILALGPIGAIISVVAGVVALIIANWDKVSVFFKNMWDGIVIFANEAINNIKNLWSGITNWFSGVVGNFINIGKDMISGLVEGLSSGAGAVVNKIKEIAQGALDAIKNFFGIHSPSRVMAGIGGYMMEGWAVGMNKTSSEAIKSAKTASSKILGTFENLTSPQLGFESSISRQGFVGGSSANITNNYVVNNNADVELISIKQAQALRTA